MSNFNSPAGQICHFWSMMTALRLVEQGGVDIRGDQVMPSSEMSTDFAEAIKSSRVISSVQMYDAANWDEVYAFRMLRSFERGSLEVRGGDWIVASKGDASMVGVVGEMVEFFALGRSFVRLHLVEVRPLALFNPMQGACLAVSLVNNPSHEQLLVVEDTSFHEVHCNADHAGELRFNYIY